MKRLPIGIEDFKELIEKEYYYVDKTMSVSYTHLDVYKRQLLTCGIVYLLRKEGSSYA